MKADRHGVSRIIIRKIWWTDGKFAHYEETWYSPSRGLALIKGDCDIQILIKDVNICHWMLVANTTGNNWLTPLGTVPNRFKSWFRYNASYRKRINYFRRWAKINYFNSYWYGRTVVNIIAGIESRSCWKQSLWFRRKLIFKSVELGSFELRASIERLDKEEI